MSTTTCKPSGTDHQDFSTCHIISGRIPIQRLETHTQLVLAQVRIVLEETYTALADAAGNGHAVAPGSETGVYMGCINYEYTEVLERGGAKVRGLCLLQLTPQCCDALLWPSAPGHTGWLRT